jgi:hypothetical protein
MGWDRGLRLRGICAICAEVFELVENGLLDESSGGAGCEGTGMGGTGAGLSGSSCRGRLGSNRRPVFGALG